MPAPSAFDLQQFFPYRLAVLAEAVSRSLAQVYGTRFDLSRDEWRVLAALAEQGSLRTTELIAHTTLEKMQVSRAVARLLGSGQVTRTTDRADRRVHVVRLTPAGAALVRKLVPMVTAREAFLLDALDADEREVLARAHGKLLARARLLQHQG